MECEEKLRLVLQYAAAVERYALASGELEQRRGTVNVHVYAELKATVADAMMRCEMVWAELVCHLDGSAKCDCTALESVKSEFPQLIGPTLPASLRTLHISG